MVLYKGKSHAGGGTAVVAMVIGQLGILLTSHILTSPSLALVANSACRPNQYRPKVGLRNKEYVLARRLRTIVREDSMGTEHGSSFIGGKNNLSDWNNVQRTASVDRTTHETSVKIDVNIDGSGQTNVSTGLSFIDHLITSLGKHSMLDIELKAISKDGIMHHLIEDVSIALSTAIDKALSGRLQITRFGYALVPMDDCLSYAAIDLVKRQFHNIQLKLTRDTIEEIPKEDLEHFVLSLAQNLNACTHVVVQYGDNDHHKVESAIKAFAVAMRMAVSIDKKRVGTPSTKGAM